MAPEQAAGKELPVTTAVDVYGLGAILYALLTGRPPFRGATPVETLRQVQHEEPRPPRALNPHINRDLETICLKCLEKAPANRYGSAEALAQDLERWVAGEPIAARSARIWERVWKWARRRPAIAGLLLVSLLSTVGMATGVLWHNAKLQTALTVAEHERQRADGNFQKARQAVDQMLTEVGEQMFETPEAQQLRLRVLERATEFYRGFLAEAPTDPFVRHETARTLFRVGSFYRSEANAQQAVDLLTSAIELLEELAAEYPKVPEYTADLAESHDALSYVYSRLDRRAAALVEENKVLDLYQRLATEFPNVVEYRRKTAIHHSALGNTLGTVGRNREAEEHYRLALAVLQGIEAEFPENGPEHAELARSGLWFGRFLFQSNRLEEARQVLETALERQEKYMAGDPKSLSRRYLADGFWWTLGLTHLEAGRAEEAERCLSQAVALSQRWVNDMPRSFDKRRDLPQFSAHRAAAQLALGRRSEAERLLRESLALTEVLRDQWPDVPLCTTDLGWAHFRLGVFLDDGAGSEESAEHFRAAIDLFLTAVRQVPNGTDNHYALAWALTACPDERFRDPPQAVEQARKALGFSRGGRYEPWQALALALLRTGQYAEALEAIENCRQLRSGGDALDWFLTAMALAHLDRKQEAREWYERGATAMHNPHYGLLALLKSEAETLTANTTKNTEDTKED